MKFWYNGKWNIGSDGPKRAYKIGMLSFQNKKNIETQLTEDELGVAVIFEGADHGYYTGFFLKKIQFLPDPAKKALFQLKHLENFSKNL